LPGEALWKSDFEAVRQKALVERTCGDIGLHEKRHLEVVVGGQRCFHESWVHQLQLNVRPVEVEFQRLAHIDERSFRCAVGRRRRKSAIARHRGDNGEVA